MVGTASGFGKDASVLHLFVEPLEQALKTLTALGHYVGQKIPSPSLLGGTKKYRGKVGEGDLGSKVYDYYSKRKSCRVSRVRIDSDLRQL